VGLEFPGGLGAAVAATTARALLSGALEPIETQVEALEDDGVRFVLRRVSSVGRKRLAAISNRRGNPFLPHDPELEVEARSETHVALLNKFPVLDLHVLLVTRRFVPQEAVLDLDDLEGMAACLAQIDGLAFYNGGAEAGASQPHKHVQFVPLPLGLDDEDLPIEAALDDGLPFRHALVRLVPPLSGIPVVDAARLDSAYRGALAVAGIDTVCYDDLEVHLVPYNLLVTRRFVLVVARTRDRVEGISLNALGYAGSLFAANDDGLATIRRLGPMNLLRAAAVPA